MSFLAQLRQQSSVPGQGLALCYVLALDHPASIGCEAALQLHLAEFEGGRFCRSAGRYQPQPAHLATPPPFLSAADIDVLQRLNVFAGNGGEQWEREVPALLSLLVASGRCFIAGAGDGWLPVRDLDTGSLEAHLHWHITVYGEHRLRWESEQGTYRFWLSGQLFGFDGASRTLSPLDSGLDSGALPLLDRWQSIPVSRLQAFAAERARWLGQGLPPLARFNTVEETARITPVLRFGRLAPEDGRDCLTLTFRYCGKGFCAIFSSSRTSDSSGGNLCVWDGAVLRRLSRDAELERGFARDLEPYLDGFQQGSAGSWHSDSIDHWHRLLGERSSLRQSGFESVIEAGFSHPVLVPGSWHIDVREQGEGHWRLDVQLFCASGGGEEFIDLAPLLSRLDELCFHTSECYIGLTLEDGRQLLLPRRQISLLREELPDFVAASGPGELNFPGSQLSRLQRLAAILPEGSRWQDDDGLLARSEQLQQPPPPQAALSLAGLRATLRPYQQQGVCWLQHIKQQGCNGLLADDMGLGKTLQAIAHLWLEKQSGALHCPALIVAPSSLLHNWLAEFRRFAPELRVRCVQGGRRHDLWATLGDCDVLVTSYALLGRDLERWRQQSLSWLILDEAQQIKNPRAQISRAVRQLTSEHRLCLSGTPMENHLGELWSLFDFLMPGCLGSKRSFKRHFQTPIEKHGNRARYAHLLSRITPFMLRRDKNAVAGELPPKTEIVRSVPMEEEQASFYQSLKENSQAELFARLDSSDDEGQQRIHALTALLKLRQACCDPALLGEKVVSAKRRHCLEMIEELVAEDRAVLVFSQFTRMLDLLAGDLEDRAIPYLTLTGATGDREEPVAAFQAGQAPVFLISLKAGGTGLNLTRADTVIHYDPWWNDAAQQQASDRAHRIGQDKAVFVYKLIMENSIEEKIADLQARKGQLGDHIHEQALRQSQRFALKLDELLALMYDGKIDG